MALQNTAQDATRLKSQPPAPVELEEALEQSAPRKPSRTTMFLWLVATSLLVFFLPLYLFSVSVNQDTQGVDSDLGFIRTSLTQVPTPAPAVQRILTPLAQAQGEINQINAVYPTIAVPRPNWPAAMTAIGNYDPNQITITSITRTINSLMITGQAKNDGDVTAYAHSLEQSNAFSRVVFQSIHAITITSTATLTRTVSPSVTNTTINSPTLEFVIGTDLKVTAP
jgi:Tfp pilus assembly protein PilN